MRKSLATFRIDVLSGTDTFLSTGHTGFGSWTPELRQSAIETKVTEFDTQATDEDRAILRHLIDEARQAPNQKGDPSEDESP